MVAVVSGTLLYDKVNFKLPLIESLVYKDKKSQPSGILRYGIVGGTLSGVLFTLNAMAFDPVLPSEFKEIGEKFKPTLITRFLYGGITEEILIRYGLMTFLVWLTFKIFGKLEPKVYWIGILVSAIFFGFGHLPIVYILMGTPTTELLVYIVFGNTIGGIIFGWLYWKKGLETAMVAHIFTHIVLLTGENIFNI